MKFFTKGSQRADISVTNLCSGVIPSHIILGMVSVPFKALRLNFNGETVLGYFQLMHSLGLWNKDKSNGIDPYQGYLSGETLFAVNLTQDLSNGSNLNSIQEGVIGVNL